MTLALISTSPAQIPTYASNAQHTNIYTPAAKNINQILWQKSIDDNPSSFGHYGSPLITAANTIIVPHKTATNGFVIDAYDGSGADKYTLTTDYVLPSFSWVPTYQPVLVGTRLYYPGNGGTVYYIDNADSNGPHTPVQLAFYGLANYTGNPSSYNNTVFICSPITADSNGDIFFGFRVQSGPAPAPISSTQSGIARIDSSGNGTFVLVGNAAADASIGRMPLSSAMALSNDETTIYTYVIGASNNTNTYLLGLSTADLSTKYKVKMLDPRMNGNGAQIIDQSTASPMVGPDGDVYAPAFAFPYNGSRGFMNHYSGDLTVTKTPGAFGWDFTPGVVPASMVPSYHGTSSYLLFCKYNNYDITDGDGVNRVALLDPNATQVDFHPTAPGLVEMREVLSVIGPTPDDGGGSYPLAVREWCINASAVNPATNSIFFNSEDGKMYRWNTVDNVLSQAVKLNDGIGQPYVPELIGPDGTVYTLNGGNFFALGQYDAGVSFTVSSSQPNMRTNVAGSSITFTAKVIGGSGTPTGTFDFYDDTYNGLSPEHNLIASGVAVDGLGQASVTTSSLSAGGSYFGNHLITAIYSGDGGHSAGQGSMLQKVHAFATTTTLGVSGSPTNYGDPVTLTANVTSGGGTPTGYVTFYDNGAPIGQVFLDGTGQAQFTTSSFSVGSHAVGADYESDTYFASSGGSNSAPVQAFTTTVTNATSPDPSTFGQTVTMSASVSANAPATGTPTGTVTFKEGATVLGSGTVDGSGNASAAISTLSVGTHSITAFFSGTGGWVLSNGSAVTHNVTATTSTTLGSSANPSSFGSSVTFTATVTSGGGTPAGSVVFTIDGTPGSPVTVDGTGNATTSTSSLTVGSHTVSAAFTGTGGFGNSSTTSNLTQNVQATTTTTVSGSPNPSNVGQSVTFTATVTSGGGTPTGSVTFKDGATTLGSGTVDGTGHATLSTSSLTAGSHSISANFVGTGGYQNSSGNTTQVVNNPAGPTTTTVASNLNPSIQGQAVTFTATVVKTGGGGIPTGSVAFKNGNSTIATVSLDGTGHAQTTTSSLATGNRNIKAIFTGTGGWGNSTSAILVQQVLADTTPPSIPQNVHATSGPGSGKITISWNASTDPDDAVANYQVFRAKTLNGSYSRVATVTGLSYLDNPGSLVTRFYYVIAVDSHGNKSAPSAKTSATAPAVIKGH